MKSRYVRRLRNATLYPGLRTAVATIQWALWGMGILLAMGGVALLWLPREIWTLVPFVLLMVGSVVFIVLGTLVKELGLLFVDLVDAVLDFLSRYEPSNE
jgi:hypothetical protein